MLSLVGSIQPDPFSPAHVPDHSVAAAAPRWQPAAAPQDVAMADVEEVDEDEDEDAFETLGRMGDEAAERKAAAEADKKARKHKRKEGKAGKEKEKAGEGTAADADTAQGKKKRKKTS